MTSDIYIAGTIGIAFCTIIITFLVLNKLVSYYCNKHNNYISKFLRILFGDI